MLDRLETIRENEKLKKKEFEEIIGKSSGYIKVLQDRNGIPGSDVLIKVSEYFRKYNMDWVLSGEGSMLKEEDEPGQQNHVAKKTTEPSPVEKETTLLAVRDDLKRDLAEFSAGTVKNFENVSEALFEILKGQQKIVRFIEQLDAKKISEATGKLEEFFKTK